MLPVNDGIEYTYVRACTAGVGEALDPATCPRMNAQCAAQEGGILVNWIEVNNNTQPANADADRPDLVYVPRRAAPTTGGGRGSAGASAHRHQP